MSAQMPKAAEFIDAIDRLEGIKLLLEPVVRDEHLNDLQMVLDTLVAARDAAVEYRDLDLPKQIVAALCWEEFCPPEMLTTKFTQERVRRELAEAVRSVRQVLAGEYPGAEAAGAEWAGIMGGLE